MFGHDLSRAPVCERLFEQGICLPSGSSMSETDRVRVIACMDAAFAPMRAAVA
jgi:dTDP-4-amino-4,6-dideoxygalactose transaminase